MSEFVQWRAFVGPPLFDPTHGSFYDWGALNSGGTFSPDIYSLLGTTLASGAVSVNLATASAFPSKGGVWIGPNGTSQGWEYATYTGKSSNTLTGLTREPASTREHNGVHNSGAMARFWWEITSNDGRLHVVRELSEEFASKTWSADIGGINFPTAALRNNHVVVLQRRTSPSASYTNYIVGFLNTPSGKDDHQNYGEWSVRIVSSASMIALFDIDSWRYGALDLAKSGSASGSQSLVGTYKERPSGDFTAAEPSFDAEATIDDKLDTLWLSERVVGSNDNDPYANTTDDENIGGLRFSQLFLNPPAGSLPKSRYLELVKLSGGMSGQSIWTANGGSGSYGWNLSSKDVPNSGRIIICESEEVYVTMNPLSEHDALYEDTGGEFFANIRAAGGELWLRLGELNIWHARIRWGDSHGGINHEDVDDRSWSGPTVTVPASGETMRYIWNPSPAPPNVAGYWQVGMMQHFGYEIHTDESAPWVSIEMPGIGLKLRDDITSVSPAAGQKLYINDPSGPSTSGLPSSGSIKVGDEVISYSSSATDGVIVSARGASSTTPAVHRIDDVVYYIDPLNGFATDGPPINHVKWTRSGGTIVPRDFLFMATNLPDPRNPDQEDWEDDWVGMANITGHTAMQYDTGIFATHRIKHLLFVFYGMSVNPSRPRINQIQAWADPASYTDNWLYGGETIGTLASLILQDAHIPSSAISTSLAASGVPTGATAKGSAWAVLVDMMEYNSCRINCMLDSKFEIVPDDTWASSSFSPSQTWTKSNASSVEYVENTSGGVSQVKLKWESIDKSSSGTVLHPATADDYGSISEVGPFIYASPVSALASARRRFYQNRYPYSIIVNCADSYPDISPGEIHRVTWRMNDAMNETNRVCLVTSVDHMVEDMIWTTTLTMVEIGRETH